MDWFISDTHFYHSNIIRFAERPFKTVEQMNKTMMDNWNERVDKNDTIIHLGDVGFFKDAHQMTELISKLNGNKILIKGNHDRYTKAQYHTAGFDEIINSTLYGPNENTEWETFNLVHKPTVLENQYLHLVGHIHQQFIYQGNNLNMSVEVWNYKPVTMKEILERIYWLKANVYDTNTKMMIFGQKSKFNEELKVPMP